MTTAPPAALPCAIASGNIAYTRPQGSQPQIAPVAKAAGIDVAFKVYERCIHGPEMNASPDSPLGRDGIAFTYDNYAEFYDKYVAQ